ncbi:MAG: tRNA (adenosine(37)-N6)-threonylcarbamoyltransferase complex ATPase subunit type 1 TsaE [Prevotella sp.]|nr:tRNA (adenosine(37)-N6)-threonylcarbamoyltransferase complex ATPase subunit type 1 TsaE [Prevotella sp.]MCM1074891.1 tRNA (adenosine(37)-N6)-threonylcarbamoyltransferase complex ATPase subunit type 1 TsaE [Ruminococcus sp.]
MDITVTDINQLPQAAVDILNALPSGPQVLAFHAPMGAGKTTLIACLTEQLGVDPDQVNSPTFAIINHYSGTQGDIYHFDMYRLDSAEQAFDIGAPDYLNSGNWCMIEWPENTPDILPDNTIHIYMEELPGGARKISIP